VSQQDLQRWEAVPRPLGEILTEVADGQCELIYMG